MHDFAFTFGHADRLQGFAKPHRMNAGTAAGGPGDVAHDGGRADLTAGLVGEETGIAGFALSGFQFGCPVLFGDDRSGEAGRGDDVESGEDAGGVDHSLAEGDAADGVGGVVTL